MGRLDCKKDREATMKPIPCLIAAASLCVGLGDAQAQSAFFLRLAPEVGRITVEHTKKVTLQGDRVRAHPPLRASRWPAPFRPVCA